MPMFMWAEKDGKNHKSNNNLKNNKMEVASGVSPSGVGFKGDKKDNFTNKAIGIGISVAVLFATVWVVGRAWKQSQKA
jgi:lysyl-tRNA synthetase class I